MKLFELLTFLFVLTSWVYAAPKASPLDAAKPCDAEKCKLPDCLCSSTDIPGNLKEDEIPQLVVLTFDDAVQVTNYNFYEQAVFNRHNPDGCPAQLTFFVSHEYTNYSMVHELYSRGHEIALHSISHQADVSYWRSASLDELKDEFVGERELISHFAQIPKEQFKGLRVPFLQISGDNSYQLISETDGLIYDCSWPTQNYREPPLWPYTLEYESIQDCPIGPCPTSSYPNVWVVPMVDWDDDNGVVCSMVDACVNIPKDVDGVFEFMKRNFERHYKTNRAPFGFFVHAAWFLTDPSHFPAYLKFLDYLQSLPDVYIVSVSRMLEWVRNPSTLNNLKKTWPKCPDTQLPQCKTKACRTLKNGTEERWLQICEQVSCPKSYPWVGDPLGEK